MRSHYYSKSSALLLSFLLAAGTMTGCGVAAADSTASSSTSSASSGSAAESSSSSASAERMESKFGGLFLTAEDINIKDSDAYSDEWESSKVTKITEAGKITKEGTYVVSGKIDGQITVDVTDEEKVWIILDGATIENSDGAAIEIKGGDKVTISLAPNTKNTLTASGISASDDVNAAIYSKSDLVLNGSGSLQITSSQDGIHSTDDLRITGGTYQIKSTDDGVVAKDRLEITDGTFTIEAGAKGLKTTNEEDEDKGFLYISDGTFDISAKDDTVNVKSAAWIAGGTFKLESGDDAVHADETLTIDDGSITVTSSVEGLEAPEIVLNGGDMDITSSDDGINAAGGGVTDNTSAGSSDSSNSDTSDSGSSNSNSDNSNSNNSGRSDNPGSSDSSDNSAGIQPVSADMITVETTDGSQTQDGTSSDQSSGSTDGATNAAPDGQMPGGGPNGQMPGGKHRHGGQKPEDAPDGQAPSAPNGQAPGGADGNSGATPNGGANGQMRGGGHNGGGRFDNESSQGYLTINGGTIYVNAEGDGLDANTAITQTGGDVTVEGPVNQGNGALDYGSSYDLSGGTLLAVGSSGMMQSISEGGSVPSIAVQLTGSAGKGDTLTVKDSSGKEIKSLKLTKSISSIVFASADLTSGETYTIYSGTTELGTGTAK